MPIAWAVGPAFPSLRAIPAVPVVPAPVEVHQRMHVGINVSEVFTHVVVRVMELVQGVIVSVGEGLEVVFGVLRVVLVMLDLMVEVLGSLREFVQGVAMVAATAFMDVVHRFDEVVSRVLDPPHLSRLGKVCPSCSCETERR